MRGAMADLQEWVAPAVATLIVEVAANQACTAIPGQEGRLDRLAREATEMPWPNSLRNRGSKLSRRTLISIGGAALVARPTRLTAQLLQTTYSEENRIKQRLRSAGSFDEVMEISREWNGIYRSDARAKDPDYYSDWDRVVDQVKGEIQSAVQDTALEALLKRTAPRLLAWISAVRASLAVLAPVYVFLEASAPSHVGSDALEIHYSNQRVQEEVRRAIDRVSGHEDWYQPIWNKIEFPEGPHIQLP